MIIEDSPEFSRLVTFLPNNLHPIHNWYQYKEGYSKDFVEYFIKEFKISKDNTVFDPFCGSGTTPLTCREHGIKSIGVEISPILEFVSKVKTKNYNLEVMESEVRKALKWKFEKPAQIPDNKWLKKIFSKYALEDIIFYKNKINQINDEYVKNFMLLGLMDASVKNSFTYKDGAFVRIVKKNPVPVKKLFQQKIRKMLRDLRKVKLSDADCKIILGDARKIKLDDNSADFVITSPPYLNKIEYTKIYKTEYSLFFDSPETRLKSYIGEEDYFSDMTKALKEMYRITNKKLAIVIGGGCFKDRAVLVDEELAKIAEDIGFNIEKIMVARNSWCTKHRTVKIGKIRESIIILNK